MNNNVILEIKGVCKDFKVGNQKVEVLKGIDVKLNKNDFLAIIGPSGSGKSTLLHVLLGLEKPTKGTVIMMDKDLYKMTDDEGAEFRKTRIAVVYQQPYWIKSLSVLENVAFPLFLMGQLPNSAFEKARKMLEIVGMLDWSDYMPTELSSGQQQKISLARAMINDPSLLVADEPTGNLDSRSGEEIMRLLAKMNKEEGRTVVMVTHDLEYIKYANRIIKIIDGLVDDEYNQKNKKFLMESIVSKKGSREIKKMEIKRKND